MSRELTAYTEKAAREVLLAIADGKTLRQIARDGGPARNTILTWRNTYPDFAAAYRAAKEASAEAFEERALDKVDDLFNQNDYTGTKVRAIEVALGQLRWSATRRDPRNYGQTENKQVVVPIQINTSLDIGQDDADKGKSSGYINVYETTVEVPVEVDDVTADVPPEQEQEVGVGAEVNLAQPRRLKIGPPRRRKGHKTAAQTRATIGTYAAREKHKAARAAKLKGTTDGNT